MGRVLKEAVVWVEDFVREEEEPFSKKRSMGNPNLTMI